MSFYRKIKDIEKKITEKENEIKELYELKEMFEIKEHNYNVMLEDLIHSVDSIGYRLHLTTVKIDNYELYKEEYSIEELIAEKEEIQAEWNLAKKDLDDFKKQYK